MLAKQAVAFASVAGHDLFRILVPISVDDAGPLHVVILTSEERCAMIEALTSALKNLTATIRSALAAAESTETAQEQDSP